MSTVNEVADINETQHITEDNNAIIQTLKDQLRVVIDKMNEICRVNTLMLEKIQELTEDRDDLFEETRDLKIELCNLNQYGRRENVEFCNVPESIEPKDLEDHILTVINNMFGSAENKKKPLRVRRGYLGRGLFGPKL